MNSYLETGASLYINSFKRNVMYFCCILRELAGVHFGCSYAIYVCCLCEHIEIQEGFHK